MGHAADGQHVSRDAVIHAVGFGKMNDVFEGLTQNEFELFIYRRLFPEVTLAVLHPFEIGSGYAAGVGQDVWNDKHFFVRQNFIGARCGGTVSAFADDFGFDAGGILAGDDVLRGRWNQDVAVCDQQFFGVGRFSSRKAYDCFVAVAIFQQVVDFDAIFVEEPAIVFGNADDFVSGIVHEFGGIGTHVAEALNDDACGLALHAELLERFFTDNHDAATSRFSAAARASNIDGFSSHNGSHGLAHVHGVGVHHPGHSLLVGSHIGRWNIFFRAQKFNQFSGITAGQFLKFGESKFFGVYDDAALGSAEGNVNHGAFPGHPASQGADFIQRNVGRVTHAAFGWAACDGMLHAEAGEYFQRSVIHSNGDMDDDFPLGITQDLPQPFIQV